MPRLHLHRDEYFIVVLDHVFSHVVYPAAVCLTKAMRWRLGTTFIARQVPLRNWTKGCLPAGSSVGTGNVLLKIMEARAASIIAVSIISRISSWQRSKNHRAIRIIL